MQLAWLQELPKDTPIERPWIAEMFGIALGAAQLGIHHRTYDSLVAHPPDISLLNREGKDHSVVCEGEGLSRVGATTKGGEGREGVTLRVINSVARAKTRKHGESLVMTRHQ